jgi:hypothetical protein
MEWVSILAGEQIKSHIPSCACPVVAKTVIHVNDHIVDDDLRLSLMKPLITRLLNSKSTNLVEQHRAEYLLKITGYPKMALEYFNEGNWSHSAYSAMAQLVGRGSETNYPYCVQLINEMLDITE